MKVILNIITLLIIVSCNSLHKHTNGETENKTLIETVVKEAIVIDKTTENHHSIRVKESNLKRNLTYFNKEGIWDTLKAICPASQTSKFHIDEFDKYQLVNIDSTIVGESIRDIYPLKSVYPLRIIDYTSGFKLILFFGEQYDADQITDFLAVATLDSNFKRKGELESIAGQGDFMDDSWEYYTEFKSDSLFQLTRTDIHNCENEFGNSLTGEIAECKYSQSFQVTNLGKIQNIKTDTLKIKYCE